MENRDNLNISTIINDVKNLDELLKSSFGIQVITIYKRVSNILKSLPENNFKAVDVNLLLEFQEKNLYESYLKITPLVDNFIKENKIEEALKTITELQKEVDEFLDSVQINVKQSEIKSNRISILLLIVNLCDSILNFKNMNL